MMYWSDSTRRKKEVTSREGDVRKEEHLLEKGYISPAEDFPALRVGRAQGRRFFHLSRCGPFYRVQEQRAGHSADRELT